MSRTLLFIKFLLLLDILSGAQDITRQDADSMLVKLSNTDPTVARMDLLLNIAQFHIFKPGEYKLDLDSAAVYINEAKELNKTINNTDVNGYLLLTESCLIKERGPKISVLPYYTSVESQKMLQRAITMLESGTNKDYLGRAYYELATSYDSFDSLQAVKKIKLLEQSVDAFQKSGDLKQKGMSQELLGNLYFLWGEEDKSSQMLKNALTAYNSINYPRLQEIYFLIGRTYFYKHDRASALSYFLKALKTAQSQNDSSRQLSQINEYLGILYYNIDRTDLAIKHLNNELQIARKNNDEKDIFEAVINIANAYYNAGQPQQALNTLESVPKRFLSSKDALNVWLIGSQYIRAYLALHQLNKARPYCAVLLNNSNKFHYAQRFAYNWRALTYTFVADFHFLSGDYKKARSYLAKSNAFAKDVNYDEALVQNLKLSYKLDSVEGNFKSAFNHHLQYKEKTDSISGEKKQSQFQALNVEYEVEMKEDSIKLKDKDISLLIQRNSLQQANLKRASLLRNINIAGTIVALTIIALLYRQYSQKQKSNVLITQKNKQLQHLVSEKDWLVKEIHHRVKNNFQTVMGLLGTQSAYLKNDIAINAINDSQRRIHSMSLIHQRLYHSNNLSAIQMIDYIHELVNSLNESFNSTNSVRFQFDIDPIELDLAHCIPLGLIINEAVTNSFKYAFTNNSRGIISIIFKSTSANHFLLTIKDNGIGLPPGLDVNESSTMGMNLMKGLSTEIAAMFTVSNESGTEINIRFASTSDNGKGITINEPEPTTVSMT